MAKPKKIRNNNGPNCVKQNQWIEGSCFVMFLSKFKSIEVRLKIIKN
jgi:hypothetical protein